MPGAGRRPYQKMSPREARGPVVSIDDQILAAWRVYAAGCDEETRSIVPVTFAGGYKAAMRDCSSALKAKDPS